MRVLVLGAGGIVGRATTAEAARRGWICSAARRDEVDITRPGEVEAAMAASTPDLVVNCAAFTQVDRCESEAELATRVNDLGAGIVAEACRRRGVKLVHLSTDYVFGGEAGEPYREEAPPAPLSAYGVSKLGGERRVTAAGGALLVRTSGVFGPGGGTSSTRSPGGPGAARGRCAW